MPRLIDDELAPLLSATEALIPSVSRDMANPPWEDAKGRILVIRLSPLGDVEGSTSHLLLFAEGRKALPEAYIDFGFFPDRRDRETLSAKGLPFFYGLESGRGPEDFDLILVSNSFALELLNLPYLYARGGFPMRAGERRAEASRAPIVILGGSNAACAGSLLVSGAGAEEAADSLVDGIFFGEGEGAIGELALALTKAGASRGERLAGAASIEGLWLALSGKRASRRIILPYPTPLPGYPVLNSAGADTARLQISAGCPGYCSFCLEGWESRPYRELPIADIVRFARELKAASGASLLEVYSYNFNTHEAVFELIFELNRIFRRVNFMSQRLDILADSPTLVAAELAADKRSFTLGIEGISERMRAFYRKGVEGGQIDAAASRLALPAVRELKLFYIIAGIEEDGDIIEFAESMARIAETRRAQAPGLRIIASAGYLVRLPFTPLEYAPLCLDRDRLEGIARRMEGACAASGIEFRLAADFEEYYVDQLLALGGRALEPWLERGPEEGRLYDGGLARGTGASLEAFAGDAGRLGEGFNAEKGEAWRPPLSFADDQHGVLRKQYILASSFSRRKARLSLPAPGGRDAQAKLERLMDAKRRFASILVRITFPRELSRAVPEYRSSWVMRALLGAGGAGEAWAAVFDAEEGLYSKGCALEGMVERYWGLAIYRLAGPSAARLEEAALAAGFEIVEGRAQPERVEVELEIPPAYASETEAALKAWLAEERIDFVESRATRDGGPQARRLEPSARDAKKKVLLDAYLALPEAGASGLFEIRLSLGPKARLEGWLSRLGPAAARELSLRVAAIIGL